MSASPADPRCLLFRHGGEVFALPIGAVEEIIPPRAVVPVPLVPGFIEGIISLRGRVITMVRLAGLPGFPQVEREPGMCVILRLVGSSLGFSAGEVIGIEPLEAEAGGGTAPAREGSILEVLQHGGRAVNLVDAGRLGEYVMAYEYVAETAAGCGGGRQ